MKPIIAILATTPKGEIGCKNTIPWDLPGDLARFKQHTMNNIVIVGRNTYQSLPGTLKGRNVIVVTSTPGAFLSNYLDRDNLYAANSLSDAIKMAEEIRGDRIYIAGGVSLYQEAIKNKVADSVELTLVYKEPNGIYDAVMKDFSLSGYVLDSPVENIPEYDRKTELWVTSHSYATYVRRK